MPTNKPKKSLHNDYYLDIFFVCVFVYNINTNMDFIWVTIFKGSYMYVRLMKISEDFSKMLKKRGYSTDVIEKMWKWYDNSEKKGVASFWSLLH